MSPLGDCRLFPGTPTPLHEAFPPLTKRVPPPPILPQMGRSLPPYSGRGFSVIPTLGFVVCSIWRCPTPPQQPIHLDLDSFSFALSPNFVQFLLRFFPLFTESVQGSVPCILSRRLSWRSHPLPLRFLRVVLSLLSTVFIFSRPFPRFFFLDPPFFPICKYIDPTHRPCLHPNRGFCWPSHDPKVAFFFPPP